MADGARPRLPGPRKVGGEGEPEVFCADEQDEVDIDIARWRTLAEAVLTGIEGLTFVHLTGADVVRHKIVADIVAAYERVTA